MNETNGAHRMELRDGKGATLGFVIPEAELRAIIEERDTLRQSVSDLEEKLIRLRKKRDIYLESLHALTRDRVKPLTEGELADLRSNGLTQEQFLAEIHTLFAPPASGG